MEADRSTRVPLQRRGATHREGQDRQRWLGLVAGVGMALWLGAGLAHAQGCTPATIPCQTCPPPPACTPSSTLCGPVGGGTNNTITVSFQTCTGSFDQETTTLEDTLGPANICIGQDKSVGCLVPAGTANLNVHVNTILGGAAAVAIPTLSFWALGALAVGLGALALRRLAAPPG